MNRTTAHVVRYLPTCIYIIACQVGFHADHFTLQWGSRQLLSLVFQKIHVMEFNNLFSKCAWHFMNENFLSCIAAEWRPQYDILSLTLSYWRIHALEFSRLWYRQTLTFSITFSNYLNVSNLTYTEMLLPISVFILD